MRIEIISGSPRTNSVTNRVALHLETVLKEQGQHSIGVIDLRDHVLGLIQNVFSTPQAAPAEHKELAERMFNADAFIVVTPEYNGSYSPAMQNLFDHFPKQSHKPFGIVTASPGAMGGIRAAMQLQQFIYALFGIGSPYMLITPQVDKKFDVSGNLLDESFQKSIDSFIKEFLWLAEKVVEVREFA
jgi:NAD(P)H-dependent FMN reductase